MNRLWTLWCELSGSDPGDAAQKRMFNCDHRVAALSAQAEELVKGFAVIVWSIDPKMSQTEFLDRWLCEVTSDLRRREAVAAQARVEQAAVKATASRFKQETIRGAREEVECRNRADEEARCHDRELRRRERVTAELRRVVDGRAQGRIKLERAALVRAQIDTLYCIVPLPNLAGIVNDGILCHALAAGVRHDDLSDRGVQDRREGRIVAGHPLHQYANLYINPRNAMLYRLYKMQREAVVVVQVSAQVLDLPGVLVTDGNAAARRSGCWPVSEGLACINLDQIRSMSWCALGGGVDPEMKRITQAEVLVPRRVDPRFIRGFLAPSRAALRGARRVAKPLEGRVDCVTFFDN